MQEKRTKPGEKAKHDLNEKTTYRFGNRSFIVEPVFKEETQNTLGYPRLSGTSHYSGRALFPVYIRKPKQARETNCYRALSQSLCKIRFYDNASFGKCVHNTELIYLNDAFFIH